MFGKKTAHDYQLKIEALKHKHALDLKQKEFELKHFKDDDIKRIESEVQSMQILIAEYKKENTMLREIVDLNADLVDVKGLIERLIQKLPEINISNLTLSDADSKPLRKGDRRNCN